MTETDLFGTDIAEKRLAKPFVVYDPQGRLMKITGEYDLGNGACFYAAEEIPVYGTEQRQGGGNGQNNPVSGG